MTRAERAQTGHEPADGPSSAAAAGGWLTSFFERLAELEPILRVVLRDAPLSAELTFRGNGERTVLLDFTRTPARIAVGKPTASGRIRVVVASPIMHAILLGRLSPGEALGRRELLLRGAPAELAKFIPLFDFAPVLYREHLADLGVDGFARPTGARRSTEGDMKTPGDEEAPLGVRVRQRSERVLVGTVTELAYAAGYGMGVLRHRFLRNLSLFDVLGAMARGVAAASPPDADRTDGDS
jgi:hypothetical protein